MTRALPVVACALLAAACTKAPTSPRAGSSGSSSGASTTGSTGSTSASSSASSSSGGATTGGSGSTSASSSSGSTASAASSTGGSTGAADAGPPDAGPVDLDQDGLDDAWELQVARAYLPYLSFDPHESCGTPSGLVVRVSPHPADASRPPRYLAIRYDHLFQQDCGASGHVGDDENIAVTVDTSLPPPQGIMVIAAISHRNTACEHDSYCVQQGWAASPCSGYATCDRAPDGGPRAGFPIVYVSKDKHGSYATTNGCTFGCDFGACGLSSPPSEPPLVNAGEPGHPLTRDLTDAGLVTAANGWSEPSLFAYDPWGSLEFGSAGTVSADLTDAALEPPLCQ